MAAALTFDGIARIPGVEAAAQRWATRLESSHQITRCSVSIRIDSYLLGLGKRARVDLVLAAETGELAVTRTARFREDGDLYFMISDAFRDAHHRLA
jgi:hypothetical protein